ncbi:UNVERIFIED_CONTAM: hypothetical protein FKN15_042046 [Acipenser sinensis]
MPLVQELTATLREWAQIWHKLFVNNKTTLFRNIQQMSYSLIEYRSQIVSGTLPKDDLVELKKKVTAKIDYGNRILGLDLVVRDDSGNALDPESSSTVSLFRAHETASRGIDEYIQEEKSRRQNLEMRRQSLFSSVHTYSLFMNLKNFVCNIGEDAELLMSLYDPDQSDFISENYLVRWGSTGMPKEIEKLNNLQALFTDLSSSDLIHPRVFLVCQIVRVGCMELKEGKKHTAGLRRPFGVAVMDITDIAHGKVDDEEKQHFIPFQQIAMETYIRQRQLIMSPLIPSRVIGENEPLTSVFNKVIAAREVNHKGQGNVRNDIYVTLVQGEFDKGKKKTPKNVEVMMCVLDEDGVPVQKAIFPGAGCEGISEYKSVIYYQVKQPCWNETVKVAIPIEDVCRCHLRFTFRHRSSQECEFTAVCLHEDRESRPLHSDPQHPPAVLPYSPCKPIRNSNTEGKQVDGVVSLARDRSEKPFGVAFVRLMNVDGTTLRDGRHDLILYKGDVKKAEDAKSYLSAPGTREEQEDRERQSGKPFHHSSNLPIIKDIFQISTLTCSTKLTQNVNVSYVNLSLCKLCEGRCPVGVSVDLLALLNWRSNPENREQTLQRLMQVQGSEIVKVTERLLTLLTLEVVSTLELVKDN